MLDLYNVFNTNYVAVESYTYGPSWRHPSATQGGRLLKFGLQLVF